MEDQNINPEINPLSHKIKDPFILAALRGDNMGLLWKYIGGTLMTLGGFFIGQFPLGLLVMVVASLQGISSDKLSDPAIMDNLAVDKNLIFFFSLLAFVIGDFTLWLVNKYLHKRTFISLITPLMKVDWKKILLAFAIYFLLTAIVEGIGYYLNPDNYIFQLQWNKFIPLLFLTVIVMPFQTSFEELLFRGYLYQGIGLVFKNAIPSVIITSLLFALMHTWNPEVTKFGFWTMFPFYFGFGLMLGFIVMTEKSLEISLAVHAANNMFSALFLTFKGGALQTDAVFLQKEMDPAATMPYYFASMFVFLLICSFVFGWWKRKQNDLAVS